MSYPVLDPVSQAYPEVEGRLLTCYSPVRRSSTPEEAFPHDLHVLSTPPAFVLSQDQTLQQESELAKNTHPHTGNVQAGINHQKKLWHWLTNTLSSSQRTNTHHTPTHQGQPVRRSSYITRVGPSCQPRSPGSSAVRPDPPAQLTPRWCSGCWEDAGTCLTPLQAPASFRRLR